MQQASRKSPRPPRPGKFYWLYGAHAARAALANSRREIRKAVLSQAASEAFIPLCRNRGVGFEVKSPQDLAKLLPTDAVHQGVALEVALLPDYSLEEYLQEHGAGKALLLLDQVTDPHNVGAILRSAAAFDAGAVIVTRDHAPQESAVLAKAASGALEIVPIVTVTNLSQAMEGLKKAGYWCVGLDGEARETIGEAKLAGHTALVLGAEGRGLRRLTAERCDRLVRLPISPKMESLNVSNAAAVALYAIAN
jgi:23S rRNA (guanosine2251-2'-O)-methyltransferase